MHEAKHLQEIKNPFKHNTEEEEEKKYNHPDCHSKAALNWSMNLIRYDLEIWIYESI